MYTIIETKNGGFVEHHVMKPTQVELAVDLAAAWNITIADVTQQLRDAKVKREAHGDGTPLQPTLKTWNFLQIL